VASSLPCIEVRTRLSRSAFRHQELPVLKSNLTQVINQHVCISNGVVHLFNVQWAAPEPRWAPGRAHYLVAVEVLPEQDEPRTVHLMLRRSIPPNALLKLLDDAVEASSWEGVAHGS
jgi:hypothetical protein